MFIKNTLLGFFKSHDNKYYESTMGFPEILETHIQCLVVAFILLLDQRSPFSLPHSLPLYNPVRESRPRREII